MTKGRDGFHLSSFISHSHVLRSFGEGGSSLKRFTLIELLVVIAIIAILAGMLLPSLSKVKSRGKAVTCMSNQKNCVYALTNYANTFSDYFPAARSYVTVSSAAGNKEHGWIGILIREGLLPQEVKAVGGNWVRQTEGTVIKCPSVIYRGTVIESAYYGDRTYGLIKGQAPAQNGDPAMELGPASNYSASMRHVIRSNMAKSEYKEIPMGGDSIHTRDAYQPGNLEMVNTTVANRYSASGSAQRTIHLRHLGKGNIFYADGHVVSAGPKDITPKTFLRYADKIYTDAATFL